MTRRKSIVALALGFSMLLNVAVYAEAPVESYNLHKLSQKYINESLDVRMIELDTKLLQVQFNAQIEDYKKFKDIVDASEDNMNAAIAYREESIRMAERARDEASIKAAADNANAMLVQYIRARSQFRMRVKEDVRLKQTLEPVIFQISQAEARKESNIAKLKYDLERDYYNLILLHNEIDLIKKDIVNLQKKIQIDETRKEIGMVTALEKEDTLNQLRELEQGQQKLKNNLQLALDMFKTKLNINTDEEINIIFQIPEIPYLQNYKLTDVTALLKRNNLDYGAIKHNVDIREGIFKKLTLAYERVEEYAENQVSLKQIEEEQDQIKVAEIEFYKAEIQQHNLEKNLELYAVQTFYEYQAAKDTLVSNILYNNDLYESKMNNLELNYKFGLISQLDYEFQKQQLNRGLNKLRQDIINFVNAKSKMDLMTKGVMVTVR